MTSAPQTPTCRANKVAGWAASAVLHIHPMSPWWQTIHGTRRRRVRLHAVEGVTYLPKPIAGYRLRYDSASVLVEIKPSRAPAILLARCGDAASARAVLATIAAEHMRPFLGEIGTAA